MKAEAYTVYFPLDKKKKKNQIPASWEIKIENTNSPM